MVKLGSRTPPIKGGEMGSSAKAREFGRRVRRLTSALAVGVPLVCLAQVPDVEEPDPAIILELGQSATTVQRADAQIRYFFEASAGQSYLIEVQQRGLDFIVDLTSPAGVTRSYDSPLLRDERELALVEDAEPGRYVIEIRSEEHTGVLATHVISVDSLGFAVADSEAQAWRGMSQGAAANFEATSEAWNEAVRQYELAAQGWRDLEKPDLEAFALFSIATIEYWHRYDWQRAADLAQQAADIYARLNQASLAANAIHLRAAALVERAVESTQASSATGQSEQSLSLFDEALGLLGQAATTHEQLGNVYDLGLVKNNLGYTYYYMGDLESARPYYQGAVSLMRNADEWTGELNPLANLALIDADQGYLASASDNLERILEILPPGRLLRYKADTLDNLGTFDQRFGNLESALQLYTSALEIHDSIDDAKGSARSLAGIGQTYLSLGELELAEQYLRRALPLVEAAADGRIRQEILKNLGNIAFLNEDYRAALDLHGMTVDAATSDLDRGRWEALRIRDLQALGRLDDASAAAKDLIRVADELGSEILRADALRAYGRSLAAGDVAERAIPMLQEAQSIYDALSLELPRAETLHSLALVERSRGRLDEATRYGEQSLELLEKLRVRVADPELRAFYSGLRRDYYDVQIDLLMTNAVASATRSTEMTLAALEMSERARSRLLSDLLMEASQNLKESIDPELRRREADLYEHLAEVHYQREQLLQQDLDSQALRTRMGPIAAELAATENEANLVEIEIRSRYPELSSLISPQSLTAGEVRSLLDSDTVMLQYALGEAASYVWVVTSESVAGVRLAGRSMIEAAARRAYESLRRDATDAASGRRREEDLSELSGLILEPVSGYLDRPKVLLSLDGALQYIPFSVLPVQHEGEAAVRFVEAYQIAEVPSMSVLAAQRARDADIRPRKTLAVFADPVFDRDDPRFNGLDRQLLSAAPDHLVARSSVGLELARLPHSGNEAQRIAALVSPDSLLLARGFGVNREAIFGAPLADYRFLHFATHGLIDSRYPALSALALSQIDEQGNARTEFLRLHDIYDLKLNADLVVLSACETALGREVRGEGLVGLTQGFMYAGARSLLVSLWQVPDRATAELMVEFYSAMLERGLAPAEALRVAQLSMQQQRAWRDPYFWSAFIVMGE